MIQDGSGSSGNLQKHLNVLLSLTRKLSQINTSEATIQDWNKITKSEVDNLITHIMKTHGDNNRESSYTCDHKQILMLFLRFLITGHRKLKKGGNPALIANIEFGKVRNEINPADLITPDEIEKLLIACEVNDRDRAFLSVLAEAGPRASELLGVRIKDVDVRNFTKDGKLYKVAKIHVNGKTGRRGITVAEYCIPYLLRWLEVLPQRKNPEAPIFPNLEGKRKGQPMDYDAARRMLKSRMEIADFSKERRRRINLHLFRHTAATRSAVFMKESQLRKYFGWTASSSMPARYVHLVESDVDDAIFNKLGIVNKIKEEFKTALVCNICQKPNPYDSEFCAGCRYPLTAEAGEKLRAQQETQEAEKQKDLDKVNAKLDKVLRALEAQKIMVDIPDSTT